MGPGWPTPIHGPGERERHDCCEVDRELLHKRVHSGPKRGAAAFVLPKGVWTMSALTSALLAAAEGVSGLDLAVPRDRREEEGRTGSRRSDTPAWRQVGVIPLTGGEAEASTKTLRPPRVLRP